MTEHTKKTLVIKVGGALVAQGIDNLVTDIADLVKVYNIVIVHGGGPQINELYKKMDKSPKIYKTPKGFSTRHTDPEAIDIIKMALAGYVNKTITAALIKKNVKAFGFTGADGKLIKGVRKDKIMVLTEEGKRLVVRNEFSGKDPVAEPQLLEILIENGFLPVIGSLSISQEGDLINIDGDRVATAIAIALKSDILISLTDVEGVYSDFKNKTLIKRMKFVDIDNWLPKLSGGMKKKLFSAKSSINAGINTVIITSGNKEKPLSSALEGLTGTTISNQ